MKAEYIILHHSGTPITQSAADLDNYYKEQGYNQGKLGMYASFHYSIDYKGVITRHRQENEIGYHSQVEKVNYKSIAICLIGNFDEEEPLEVQKSSLQRLVAEIRERQGRLPVIPYNEFDSEATSPGKKVTKDWIKGLFAKEMTLQEMRLQEEIDKLRKELEEVYGGKREIDTLLEKQRVYIKNLEVQSEQYKKDLAQSIRKQGKTETNIENLRSQLINTRKDLERVLQLAGQKETELHSFRRDSMEKKKELEEVLKLIGRKEADTTLLNNQVKSTKLELENVLKLAGRREVEANDLRVQLIKKEKRIKHLKVQLVMSRREINDFKTSLERAEEKLARRSIFRIFRRKKKLVPATA